MGRGGRVSARAVVLAALLALLLAAPASAVTVWAVGDGGVPGPEDDAVASRVAQLGIERLLYLGDVYETGTAAEYAANYQSSWGRFKAMTSPTPGNHEWGNRAQGYDPYWGALAPQQPGGGHYYSFDLAGWHVVSLNSHEDSGWDSPQRAWLRRDLERYSGTCTIAFWHRPRWNAGAHSDAEDTEPLYSALTGRATMLLNGHDHNYQRFKPRRGITQFIVGTGGRVPFYNVNEADSRLAHSDDDSLGALRMELTPGRADWQFIDVNGSTLDRGTIPCTPHPAQAAGAPRLRFTSPAHGRSYRTPVRSVRGRAANVAGPVRLTLVRRASGRCSFFDGRRFRSASCRTRRSIAATGSRAWRIQRPGRRALPRGVYTVVAKARSADGRAARAAIRFSVR